MLALNGNEMLKVGQKREEIQPVLTICEVAKAEIF